MRPPRIPVLLPWEQPVIYFLTFAIKPRAPVLATDAVWTTLRTTFQRLDRWETFAGVLMPDHLHLLAAPLDRDRSPGDFSKWLKRWFNEALLHPDWEWQEGVFDRLLRRDESAQQKWQYIRENPVRAGLVEHWQDWRYQFGFPTEPTP